MIELTDEQKYAIQKNKRLLNNGDFEVFFEKLPEQDQFRSPFGNFFAERFGINNILESMDNVPAYAFMHVNSAEIFVPGNIHKIGECAFQQAKCKKVEIEDGVEFLDHACFAMCNLLTEVKLPNTLKRIPAQAFYGCESLQIVEIPDSVVEIDAQAFDECANNIRFIANVRGDSNKLRVKNAAWYKGRILFRGKKTGEVDESLEELQTATTLNEDVRTLNEAYANMPDWLRERLNYLRRLWRVENNRSYYGSKTVQARVGGNNASGYVSKYSKQSIEDPQNPGHMIKKPGTNDFGYKSPSRGDVAQDRQGEQKGHNLFIELIGKGIDLTRAKFIEGTPPATPNAIKSDPRCQEPNIPFFYIESAETGQSTVYAPGVNDFETFDHNGWPTSLKDYPKRDLINFCKGFCYLDTSDPDNYYSKEDRSKFQIRKDTEKERKEDPYNRYGYTKKERKENKLWGSGTKGELPDGTKLDKSGYKVKPLSQKFQDKLRDLDRNDVYRIVNRYYDKVSALSKEVTDLISQNLQIKKFQSTNYRTLFSNNSGFSDLMNKLGNLTSKYDSLVSRIQEVLSAQTSKAEKENMIDAILTDTSSWRGGNVYMVDKAIEDLENLLNKYHRFSDVDGRVSSDDDDIANWMKGL